MTSGGIKRWAQNPLSICHQNEYNIFFDRPMA
jgi:hypothetical protein